ncbi:thiamine pyrophosphate-binding protein [Kibdelosporangium phytohabitans]|uniref:Thiamine pyrophosphate-binding protein n=1 Tax=Kibdelosporangium phytohabitans TaxID=860235 RepID=A0A0N7F5R4_9PSEU|nr:thiamine pyrophosphate-binding protein [Kibdelosporangium phytohabitans]
MVSRLGKAAIFEQFAADGITRMFGNPGTVEQGMLDVAEGLRGFEYVLALHESVAVAMADGYARATARTAVVQLHSAVGLGNAIGMLYQAKRGHSPLLVIAGEAGVRYDAMDGQMAADLVRMAEPVTKYATRVTHPGSLLRVLRRAVKVAMTPPRGPVFVALPMDVLDAPCPEPVVPSTIPVTDTTPPQSAVDEVAGALRAARKPIILVGDGIAVSGAQQELTRLAELLDAPVWGVDCSEVNMDTTHPLWRGQLGHMFGHVSANAVGGADLVLIAGTAVFPEVFPYLDSPFRPDATVVQIDADTHEIAKNFPVDVAVAADPKRTLAAVGGALAADHIPWQWTWQPPSPDPDDLMELFAAELAGQAGDRLVLFDEALTSSPALVRHLPPRRPGSYFLTRGGSLGVGIPGAIGVQLARPGADVVAFTGDGGSMYTIQALWTAARHAVPAKFVICDNHRYELLGRNIEQYWRERGIASHRHPGAFDLSHPEIGFTELARSLGVDATRVEKPAQVRQAVRRLLAASGPFLVDLITGGPR